MKRYPLFLFSLIICNIVSSQIKGVVVDDKNNPISYVNISVENQKKGATSEENGAFIIDCDKQDNLIFSALGFEKKIIQAKDAKKVVLNESSIHLEEVIIVKKYGTKTREIGLSDSKMYQSFENSPRLDVKFFPFEPSYKKTRFLKTLIINAESRIENAVLKIHFYKVNETGLPGEEMLNKNYIVSIKKGTSKNIYDISDFNLKIPENGMFVGFEKLLIERNKIEKTLVDYNTNKTIIQTVFYPTIMYDYIEREISFFYNGGKWESKQTKNEFSSKKKEKVYEPAINLILSN